MFAIVLLYCCCCLTSSPLSWTAEATSATALRRTLVYLGVGFSWLLLIEFRDEPNGPGKSQGHCRRTPQISWVGRSSISQLYRHLRTLLKDMRDRLWYERVLYYWPLPIFLLLLQVFAQNLPAFDFLSVYLLYQMLYMTWR